MEVVIYVVVAFALVVVLLILAYFYFVRRTVRLMAQRVVVLEEKEKAITDALIGYQELYFEMIESLRTLSNEEADSLLEVCNPKGDISTMTIEEKEDMFSFLNFGFKTLHSLYNFYPEFNEDENYARLVDQVNYKRGLIEGAKSIYNSFIYAYNQYLGHFPMIVLAQKYNYKRKSLFEIKEYKPKPIQLDSDDDEDEFEEVRGELNESRAI